MNEKRLDSVWGIPMACCNCGSMELNSMPIVCPSCGGYCCSEECLNEHDCDEEDD